MRQIAIVMVYLAVLTAVMVFVCVGFRGHKKTKDAKGRAPSQDLKSSLRTSLSLKTDQGLSAVAEETVVPNVEGTADAGIGLTDTELSAAHIYFKDLKLLAHDNSEDSGEDESIEQESGELASLQHQPSFAMSDGSSPGADLSPSMTSMVCLDTYHMFLFCVSFLCS